MDSSEKERKGGGGGRSEKLMHIHDGCSLAERDDRFRPGTHVTPEREACAHDMSDVTLILEGPEEGVYGVKVLWHGVPSPGGGSGGEGGAAHGGRAREGVHGIHRDRACRMREWMCVGVSVCGLEQGVRQEGEGERGRDGRRGKGREQTGLGGVREGGRGR